ncbi:MAG: hypothetical protein A2Y10_03510 [Planctomycetes bacterium GWF2_41_51]|nr:MAG: hypothetical protein A2Y10_03510 [Planctomycetes bacterium GWF2_41_51]HBG28952.1 hypothetical protein [Phycisphaerales bacterium]
MSYENLNNRQREILEYIESKKTASYLELESKFDVSNMTIRRDIDFLAQEELVIKTLGGAQLAKSINDVYESPVANRLSINGAEKKAIAIEASNYIEPGEIIYLDGSSTCLELAKKIAEQSKALTIVTNSLLIHMELARSSNISIVSLGGQYDPVSCCLTGPNTEEHAHKYFVKKAFFSTKGFSPSVGTFESSAETFRIKQILASHCDEVILLADHTKFGQKSLCKVFDISQIHTVITDSGLDNDNRVVLEANVAKVITAQLKESVANF